MSRAAGFFRWRRDLPGSAPEFNWSSEREKGGRGEREEGI